MKLYTTPPSIQTLVTWVPQSKLAFGQTLHIDWPSGLRPSGPPPLQSYSLKPRLPLAATIGTAGRLRVFLIESGRLFDSKALCRQLRVVLQRCCNKYFIL